MDSQILVGISACVLGEKVRFDSGHKASAFVNKELSPYLRFVAVCPEVGIGMSVPRPTIRLISDKQRIALVETKDASKDYTDAMQSYANQKVDGFLDQPLCGYIVCAKSPTCGMERVKVYGNNHAEKSGVGLYTQVLLERMPWLPVEEDGRLNDPVLKENFITRVFCLADFYQSMGDEPTRGKIIDFHSRYKLTLMAHHPDSYRELGRLVAHIADYDLDDFVARYRLGLMNAMAHRATRKNNTNVLMHLQGYFKRALGKKEKAELRKVIDDYRVGLLPLLAPLTLIKHYLHTYPDPYLADQRYFQPYPEELRLRYGL
ncbi:Uncharacterized conserved protein YbgA, DUF1722 family [Vibrio xiamenensis]|uniref:Uncharacterized conserved protein YbgA, DUF1722 family n=1 Tax=Vibrio xiamenensis TaxID=861298 RepID=A0A1G8AGB1_9VIBR|nr:2-thiouracil desulfurase family protein [Vibrio xiamenensis]SDH19919.1 Uncharacterized conserved protein YbgA, DUF1722 family [Vibrio xiamenensis]